MSGEQRHRRNLYAARWYRAAINVAIRNAREDLLPAQYRAVRIAMLEELTAEAAKDQARAEQAKLLAVADVVDIGDLRARKRGRRGRAA